MASPEAIFTISPVFALASAAANSLEKSVAEVGAQFAATEELKSFVRANRNGKIADNYVSAKQLSSASMSSSVGETSNTTYESARDGVCLNMFLWLL